MRNAQENPFLRQVLHAVGSLRGEVRHPRSLVPKIREFISPFCEPDPHGHGAIPRNTTITTLQLDTPALSCHHAKENQAVNRFKLRVRTYGSVDVGRAFLEVKRNIGGTIVKSRSSVPIEEWGREFALRAGAGDGVFLARGGGPFSAVPPSRPARWRETGGLHPLHPRIALRPRRPVCPRGPSIASSSTAPRLAGDSPPTANRGLPWIPRWSRTRTCHARQSFSNSRRLAACRAG